MGVLLAAGAALGGLALVYSFCPSSLIALSWSLVVYTFSLSLIAGLAGHLGESALYGLLQLVYCRGEGQFTVVFLCLSKGLLHLGYLLVLV